MAKKEMTLEERVQRLEDRAEVANLMGRYVYGHFCNDYETVADLFSMREDVTAEIANWGVYRGHDMIVRLYPEMHAKFLLGDGKGRLHANCITTPVIEIAGDGKTAKGLWFITGAETSPKEDDEILDPHWTWARYACDFIKEDGAWKIWHLHLFDVFRCPFDENWVTYSLHRDADDAALDSRIRLDEGGITPENPTTFHWQYRTDAVCVLEPEPPVPYQSFDETITF